MDKLDQNLTPGENIKEFMKAHGWTQEDLAEVMNFSLKTVNKLIQNKQSITVEMATALEAAFPKVEAWKWFVHGSRHQVALKGPNDEVQVKSKIYKYVPVAELIKRKWFKKTNKIEDLQRQVEEFLGKSIADLEAFYDGSKKTFAANFRKSEAHKQFNDYAAETWCHMVELCSGRFEVPAYKKAKLETIYDRINEYTVAKDGVEQFLEDLNESGVKFMVLPHLQKTYIDGAAFLIDKSPVIVYTGRYKRLDNFWFTVAHEIAHVLKHLNKNQTRIIDDIHSGDKTGDIKEKEADDLAKQHLKLEEIRSYFKDSFNYITVDKITSCSEDLLIHKAIIMGALAFEKTVSYKHLHLFNEDITEKIPTRYLAESYIN